MTQFLYLKYGELSLKGKNKVLFINRLYDNVKYLLVKEFPKAKIEREYDCMSIRGIGTKNIEVAITLMQKVPGFNLIIPAYACDHDFQFLKEQIVKTLKNNKVNNGTFKVNTKRSYKQYHLNSMEISKLVGEAILDKCKTLKVDIHKPHTTITIEIKEKIAIFYFRKIKGRGGFPLGINGRVLLLMSGGIDSPVAANLLLKKGLHVDFLTFISPPHTDEQALNKVKTLKKIITLDNHLYKSNLYVINFTNVQHEITHISNHSYQITLMRRYFFRIAKELAIKYNYGAIATGESLGQVASQTLESMSTIQNAIGDFTTIRPLITYDKEEIIQLAKQWQTYETSILPYADACSLFVPANPTTKPTAYVAEKLEAELELVDLIVKKTIEKVEII